VKRERKEKENRRERERERQENRSVFKSGLVQKKLQQNVGEATKKTRKEAKKTNNA
jgi:hypothetical protein